MIKVFGAGRGKKAMVDNNDNGAGGSAGDVAMGGSGSAGDSGPKQQPGEIRLQKELEELDLPSQVRLSFPDESKKMTFCLDVKPEEGYWKDASFR